MNTIKGTGVFDGIVFGKLAFYKQSESQVRCTNVSEGKEAASNKL